MRRCAALLGCAGMIVGCHTVTLATDPTSRDRGGAVADVFDIDWWVRLVDKPMMEYQPRETASPAIDPQTARVIVETRDGWVRSLSPDDGKVEWDFKTQGPFNAGALVHDGVVYVPGGDGTLYALKSLSGELLWKYAAGEELATTPVMAGERVLVASQGDTLFSVDAKSGKWVWQYRRDAPSGFTVRGVSAPVIHADLAYMGFSDGYVVAIQVSDGVLKWERNLSGGGTQFLDVDATPVLDDSGRLYVASYKEGVFALNAASGDLVWQSSRAGVTSLLPKGEVLFTSGDAQVGAVLKQDGHSLWSLDLPGRSGRAPVFAKGMLVVPTSKSLLFVDPASGRPRTSWNPGDGVSATPTWANSRLYVLSNNGLVYAVRLRGKGG